MPVRIVSAIFAALMFAGFAHGQFPVPGEGQPPDAPTAVEPPPKSPFGAPPGAKPLSEAGRIWINPKLRAVYLDGVVAHRDGPPIEMFACPSGSKEHESVVAVFARPMVVHAGLLAVGAEVGAPVQFDPYQVASGTQIDIFVEWFDSDGRRHKAPAQQWVRHISTGKPLGHPWVFAGSGFWTDEETGARRYHADSGDFICVSNFQTATLDLPVPSSQATADLMYEAYTEHIPPTGTPVRLVLSARPKPMPKVDKPAP